MEEFEEMKRRSLEDVEELLGVSFVHAFTSLLPFFFLKKKQCAKACDEWARGFYEKARVHWIRRLDVIRDRYIESPTRKKRS
jgi:hypothetical protein